MKKQQKYLLASTLMAVLLPFSGVASSFKPANFDNGADLVSRQVQSAHSVKDRANVVVYCQADVAVDGQPGNVACFENSGLKEVQTQTQGAIASLKFNPAEVDGVAVPVRLGFRVLYSINGDDLRVTLIPNLGTMQGKFGASYIAPQERLDSQAWYDRYTESSSEDAAPFFNKSSIVRVGSTVNEKGEVSATKVLQKDRRYKKDANLVQSALKTAKFIPGFVDNQPTEMGYVAVVNYPDSDD